MKERVLYGLFFFENELFSAVDGAAFDLCSILSTSFPNWSRDLRVALDEEDQGVRIRKCDELFSAIDQVCSRMIGPRWIVLSGKHDGVSVYMKSSRARGRAGGNSMSLYLCETVEAEEKRSLEEAASSIFRQIVRSTACRYARLSDQEEFREKNLVTDAAGTRAVGVNLSEGLPGLYWLNYLGPRYVSLVGAHSIAQSEAERVEEVNSGYLLQLYPSASDWPSPVSRRAEAALKEHLGQQIFSLCADDGKGLVPDFKAPLPV